MLNEFSIIQKFFNQQRITPRDDVIVGIGDDAAIVKAPSHQELAITTDTLISGVHFPVDTHAFDMGYKSLAVNLSDLAAMGATPAWITLALTLPEANPDWLSEFSKGLFALANPYEIQLIGGDLTRGALSITIQAIGLIKDKLALRRDGAKIDDLIYITHTLGDAALALQYLQKTISIQNKFVDDVLIRLNRPEPRIIIGQKLRGIAHAAIDISDGLISDLGHILEKSQLGGDIYLEKLPLSQAMRESVSKQQAIQFALTGGDDYELCFTLPEDKIHLLDFECTCIGKITSESGLRLYDADNRLYNSDLTGYQHF